MAPLVDNLVSIITPSFNSKKYINATFESVINQTHKEWEWIIVDDCSTDGSYEFVLNLSKKDRRIRVLKLEHNSGTSVARNEGLKKSRGRYVSFLDSDDLLSPFYLEKQLLFIQKNGPIVSSGYLRKTDNGKSSEFFVPDSVDYKTILKGNPLSCLTTMYDRSIIGEQFFPIELKKREDYVFWLNILKMGFVAKGNHEILATYVIHQGSKTSNKFKLIKYMYVVYHKTQGFNPIKSCFYVVRWAFYGKKKYKNIK